MKHLAYEYARRGARLALVARREQRLQEVAAICEIIGSPEAVYILADVSKIEDCKRFVDATVNHFGYCKHRTRGFHTFFFLFSGGIFEKYWFLITLGSFSMLTVDHLVTNAGVAPVCLFEDYDDITKASPAMVIKHFR